MTYNTIKLTPNLIITNKKSNDSWFLTKNDQIVKMQCAKFENGRHLMIGVLIVNKTHLFSTDTGAPMNSTKLKIFSSDGTLEHEPRTFQLNDFASKMICLPSKDNFAFIPIIHTMELNWSKWKIIRIRNHMLYIYCFASFYTLMWTSMYFKRKIGVTSTLFKHFNWRFNITHLPFEIYWSSH